MSRSSFLDRLLPFLPALLRSGRRLTGNPTEAQDLVQDTLVRALEKQGELRDPQRLRAWLLAVQRSVFLNSRRGLRRTFEVIDGGLASGRLEPVGDLSAELASQTLDERIEQALATLPEEWREAIWLRAVEDLSYEEIAAVQGCPIGTVRSRLARARQTLIKQLGTQLEIQEKHHAGV